MRQPLHQIHQGIGVFSHLHRQKAVFLRHFQAICSPFSPIDLQFVCDELLILDEATEGLSPTIRLEIWKVIEILKNKNISILIIDKSLKQLQSLADKFYILEKGRTVWKGLSKELTTQIAQKHLGV